MNLGLYFSPYTKINTNWIKDLNAKPKDIKLLENTCGLGLGKGFSIQH